MLELTKPVRFMPEDRLEWKDANYRDDEWPRLPLRTNDSVIDLMSQAGFKGIGWYRIGVCVDSTLQNTAVALRIVNSGAMELYWDGQLVNKFGQIGQV